MSEERIVWYCDGYFPFDVQFRGVREWDKWDKIMPTEIQAKHLQFTLLINYYKQKRSSVSKKHRRAKKEHQKFLKLINQYTKEQKEFFEEHLEYFI